MANTHTNTKDGKMAAPIKATSPIQKQLNAKMIERINDLLDCDGISEAEEDWALELLEDMNNGRLYTPDEYQTWLELTRKARKMPWITG